MCCVPEEQPQTDPHPRREGQQRQGQCQREDTDHLVEPVMKHLHEATHCGRDSLTTYVKLWLTGPGISRAIRKVIAKCVMCWKNNFKTDPH